MSRINLINNLFLGLQELQRQSKFIKEDGYIRLFKSIINNFGIVNVEIDSNFDNFKVQAGTNTGTIKIDVDSYAIDKDLSILTQKAIDNIAVTDDSNWYWIKISYKESNIEEGVINLAVDGDITGINTKFSQILRSQSNYPVKIHFPNSVINIGDYQVVSVLSDTQAILSGSSGFTPENDLEFMVVGSYTPGVSVSGNDRLPYFYDSCLLEFVAEINPNEAPAKDEDLEFYIARVRNVSGTVTIQDKRTEIFGVAKINTGWIQPTLSVEFTNVTGREIQYCKNYIGEVEIKGSFLTTDGTAILFTLPEGFRPPYTIQGIYGYDDGSVIRIITVETTGAVKASSTFPFHGTNVNEIINLRFKTE